MVEKAPGQPVSSFFVVFSRSSGMSVLLSTNIAMCSSCPARSLSFRTAILLELARKLCSFLLHLFHRFLRRYSSANASSFFLSISSSPPIPHTTNLSRVNPLSRERIVVCTHVGDCVWLVVSMSFRDSMSSSKLDVGRVESWSRPNPQTKRSCNHIYRPFFTFSVRPISLFHGSVLPTLDVIHDVMCNVEWMQMH